MGDPKAYLMACMAVRMAAGSNLPTFLYGSSEMMAIAYGISGEFLKRPALTLQSLVLECTDRAHHFRADKGLKFRMRGEKKEQ